MEVTLVPTATEPVTRAVALALAGSGADLDPRGDAYAGRWRQAALTEGVERWAANGRDRSERYALLPRRTPGAIRA